MACESFPQGLEVSEGFSHGDIDEDSVHSTIDIRKLGIPSPGKLSHGGEDILRTICIQWSGGSYDKIN